MKDSEEVGRSGLKVRLRVDPPRDGYTRPVWTIALLGSKIHRAESSRRLKARRIAL